MAVVGDRARAVVVGEAPVPAVVVVGAATAVVAASAAAGLTEEAAVAVTVGVAVVSTAAAVFAGNLGNDARRITDCIKDLLVGCGSPTEQQTNKPHQEEQYV